MRGQAFSIDALLALSLALLLAQALENSSMYPSGDSSLRIVHACYDLSNAVYADEKLYAATSGIVEGGRFNASNADLARMRLLSYSSMLGVTSVALQYDGSELAVTTPSVSANVESCCFPIISARTGVVRIACLEVGA